MAIGGMPLGELTLLERPAHLPFWDSSENQDIIPITGGQSAHPLGLFVGGPPHCISKASLHFKVNIDQTSTP